MENNIFEDCYRAFRQKVEPVAEIIKFREGVDAKGERPSEYIERHLKKTVKQWRTYIKVLTKAKERRQQLLAQEARELSNEAIVTEGDAVKKELETVEGDIVGIEDAMKKLEKTMEQLEEMAEMEKKLLTAEAELLEAQAEALKKVMEKAKEVVARIEVTLREWRLEEHQS